MDVFVYLSRWSFSQRQNLPLDFFCCVAVLCLAAITAVVLRRQRQRQQARNRIDYEEPATLTMQSNPAFVPSLAVRLFHFHILRAVAQAPAVEPLIAPEREGTPTFHTHTAPPSTHRGDSCICVIRMVVCFALEPCSSISSSGLTPVTRTLVPSPFPPGDSKCLQ